MGSKLPASYIEVPGVGRVMSGVALRGKDLLEIVAYATDNSLRFYDSPQINRVAEFTKPESPDKKWAKQQAKALGRKRESIEEDYSVLRGDIWERYYARGSEILAWPPYSKNLVGAEGMQEDSDKPVLVTGYRVEGHSQDNFVIKGGKAEAIDWPKTAGEMPSALRKKLGAKFPTYVHTNPDINFYEGLRALPWDFGSRAGGRRVVLDSSWNPWYSPSCVGSLLGSLDSEVSLTEKQVVPAALTREELETIRRAQEILLRYVPKQ